MAEIRREIQTESGLLISGTLRRGRVNPLEIQRIKNDGNTQLRTAAQKAHKASLGDRLNDVLRAVSPEIDQQVRSGVWGREIEREVPEELHTENERRMLETADEGTKIRETAFTGNAPYQLRDLGDGRIVLTINLPDFRVMVGVGTSVEAAIADLEGQVKK